MSKEQIVAQEILKNIGGKENIKSMEHCATRLRLIVKDKSPLNPINKPVATNTGIIGTKISPKVRDIFCGKVISLYASSFTFPVSTPSPFIAAKTLFTNPVPRII